MNKQVELEARIAKFASRLWVGGVPLGEACIIAEQVMNPQLPGYVERGPFGMHQPCGDDDGVYNDDSSIWDGLNY
jgi:hypothetical protein